MLKFIISYLLLMLISTNIFSQRLCEESIFLNDLQNAHNQGEVVIVGNNSLIWYDLIDCNFIDTLHSGFGQTGFRLSKDSRTAITFSFDPNNPIEILKYDLITKVRDQNFNVYEKSPYAVNLKVNGEQNTFFILSDVDRKLSKYDLNTGSLLSDVTTLSQSLSEIEISDDGKLIAISSSPFNPENKIVYVYDALSLELINSFQFSNYFDQEDFNNSNGFDFNPINNDLIIASESKILSLNVYNKESIVLIDDNSISFKKIALYNDNLVIVGITYYWKIAVFN
mgnify:FL=1